MIIKYSESLVIRFGESLKIPSFSTKMRCWENFKATMKPTDDGDYKRRITRGFVRFPSLGLAFSGLVCASDLSSVVLVLSGLCLPTNRIVEHVGFGFTNSSSEDYRSVYQDDSSSCRTSLVLEMTV